MGHWITKNGKHIYIKNGGGSNRKRSSKYYPNQDQQRFYIQQQLDRLKAQKESEIARKAIKEGVSLIISHIVPMIGPIISDVIKLATLERENKEIEEQIRLIEYIKMEVGKLFEAKPQSNQQKEDTILIKESFQASFIRNSEPTKGRGFFKSLMRSKVANAIQSEIYTQGMFVKFGGTTRQISESEVTRIANKQTDHVVDCLIDILRNKTEVLDSSEKIEVLSASLLQYCLEQQEDSNRFGGMTDGFQDLTSDD